MQICWRSTLTETCRTICVTTTQHWTSLRRRWPTEVGWTRWKSFWGGPVHFQGRRRWQQQLKMLWLSWELMATVLAFDLLKSMIIAEEDSVEFCKPNALSVLRSWHTREPGEICCTRTLSGSEWDADCSSVYSCCLTVNSPSWQHLSGDASEKVFKQHRL